MYFLDRCVQQEQCQGNKVSRRSGGLEALLVASADDAECPNEDICCAESEITQRCRDYKADGYSCATQCYDIPQDFPKNPKTKTIPFLPKEAKCPRGHICCKRTEPIKPVETNVTCEETGDGYQCMDMEKCHPDTFVQKSKNTIDTVDLLFADNSLIETSTGGGIAVNNAKNPCADPTKLCCKPLPPQVPKPVPFEVTDNCKDKKPDLMKCLSGGSCECVDNIVDLPYDLKENEIPVPYTECGKHNRFGLKRGGIQISFTQSNGKPVTSQEGEWPHTCLILMTDQDGVRKRLVGGASLIAPKVIITAAHIVG